LENSAPGRIHDLASAGGERAATGSLEISVGHHRPGSVADRGLVRSAVTEEFFVTAGGTVMFAITAPFDGSPFPDDSAVHATFTVVAKKQLTYDEAQARKDRGVQFLRDVVGDDDAADNLDDEDLDSYIERKHITIVNEGARKMANGTLDPRTKQELLDEIDDLQSQLDAINDILNPPDDDYYYDDDDQD
jgi:hypothetical protein